MLSWEKVERKYCQADDPIPATADMVIGLGTDVNDLGNEPSRQSIAIVKRAAEILGATKAPTILFSGGYHVRGLPQHTEASTMAKYFQRVFCLPSHDHRLLIESKSWRTYQQADRVLAIAKQLGCRQVVIVAQQWHARRVRATFRKRWAGSGIQICVVKAIAPYGPGGSQERFRSFPRFAAWDAIGWAVSKFKGYC